MEVLQELFWTPITDGAVDASRVVELDELNQSSIDIRVGVEVSRLNELSFDDREERLDIRITIRCTRRNELVTEFLL